MHLDSCFKVDLPRVWTYPGVYNRIIVYSSERMGKAVERAQLCLVNCGR